MHNDKTNLYCHAYTVYIYSKWYGSKSVGTNVEFRGSLSKNIAATFDIGIDDRAR